MITTIITAKTKTAAAAVAVAATTTTATTTTTTTTATTTTTTKTTTTRGQGLKNHELNIFGSPKGLANQHPLSQGAPDDQNTPREGL